MPSSSLFDVIKSTLHNTKTNLLQFSQAFTSIKMGALKRKASQLSTSPPRTTSKIGKKTKRLPPRGKKPRSTIVAVSTPGWIVSEYGEIMPDPAYVTDTEPDDKPDLDDKESSECSECSDCGETYYSAEGSPSGQSLVYQGPELEVKFEEKPWIRPTPALPGAKLLELLDFMQINGHVYISAPLEYFRFDTSSPDLINDSFLQWLFVG